MLRRFAIFTLFLLTGALPAAQVVSVDAIDGTYDAGTSINIVVTFNGTVTATTGVTKLLLNVGRVPGDEAYAYANTDQTGTSVTLTYLVQAGDNTSDLDYSSVTALTGVTGMVGNLPTPGAINSLSNLANLVIDTAPIVYSVSTSLATGTYGAGQVVPITVQFSEPVTVASSTGVKLLLQLNGSTKNVDCTSGTGSTLLFNYTVGANENVTSLDYASTTALALTGISTVKDNDGISTDAVLTLPFGGSSSLRTIRIDTTSPIITNITSTATNGSYKADDSLPITVQFSELVNVVGTPTLTLNTTPAATATYTSGTGTTSLVFTYTVAGAQVSSDLDVNALTVPALSSIADAVGNGVVTQTVTSTSLATNKDLRIALVPTVTSVTGSAPTPTIAGSVVTITVALSGTPTITGSGATLTLETGTVDRVAAFTSATTPNLVFTYTVQADDNAPLLDYTSISALNLGGVVLNGFSGLSLSLPALNGGNSLAASTIKVDTTPTGAPTWTLAPALTATSIAPVTVVMTASEPVTGFTASDIVVNHGTATLSSTSSQDFIASITPQSSLYARVTVVSGVSILKLSTRSGSVSLTSGMPLMIGSTTVFVGSTTSVTTAITNVPLTVPLSAPVTANTDVWLPAGEGLALSLGANAAQDLAGNASAANTAATIRFDPSPPIVTVVAPTSNASPLNFTVNFSEDVTDLTAANLTVSGGSLGTLIKISAQQWTVPITPNNSGLVSLTVKLNAVTDTAGNANQASSVVSYKPAAAVTAITSTIADGSYKIGDSLPITLQFPEAVTVTGTPTLTLNTSPEATATYVSGSGTTNLIFTYVVEGTQTISDLDVTALTLSSGTIIDSLATQVSTTVPSGAVTGSLATNKNLRIALLPKVTSVTGSSIATPAILNSVVTIIVTLNSTDIVLGSDATLTLETGATDRAVALTSVTATTLVFTYTVQAGDVSPRLDYTSINALTLGNVKINGFTGLALTLPTVGSSSALYQSNIQVDTTTSGFPVLTTAQVGPSNTAPITVAISASEPVVNFVDADLTVTNGSATVTSVASSNNFIASLTPRSPLFMNAVQPNARQLILRARGTDPILLSADQAIKIGDHVAIIESEVLVLTTVDTTVTLTKDLPRGLTPGIDVWQATGVTMQLSIPANAVQDLAGNNSAAVDAKSFIYDPVAPIATIIVPSSSTPPYQFTVRFNETVTAPLPAAFTAVGGTVDTVTNSEPQNNAWTVDVKPTTASGTVSLMLNANAVVDQAGNANLASATVSFAALAVTKIEASPTTAKSYHPGDTVTLIATLNHAAAFATGTAIPTLALQTGTTTALATLTSPSTTATDTLTFTYIVGSSDSASDLDVVSANALDLKGRTLDGLTTLTVPAPGAAGSLSVTSAVTIDSTKPTVTFDAPTVTGPLRALLTVRFSEPLATSGNGALQASDFTVPPGVTAGTPVLSVDGRSATVEFTLPVSASTASAETTYLVTLNASAVTDVAGNVSTDTPSATITYDPLAPTLTLTSPNTPQAASPITIKIEASKPVTGLTASDCNVNYSTASNLTDINGSGTEYTVKLTPVSTMTLARAADAGVSTIRLQARAPVLAENIPKIPANTVLLIGSSVVRLATTKEETIIEAGVEVALESSLSSALALDLPVWQATGTNPSISMPENSCEDDNHTPNAATVTATMTYDPTPPMFRITAPTKLGANGSAIFTLTPSEPVINLEKAGLTATNGTVTEVTKGTDDTWTATVTPSDATAVGLSVNADAAIDAAGNPSLAEPAASMTIKPYVTKVTCKNTDGTYGSGIRLQVVVTFSEAVTVVGTPSLLLNLTTTGRKALYGKTTGNDVVFDYTTVDGDQTADLDYLNTSALALDGATINDVSSNAADRTLPEPTKEGSLAANAAIVVDTRGPNGPGKPDINDNPSASVGGCGTGSGIALILVGGWLGLGFSRRRRAA
jgi:hypothetical protein